MKLDKLGTLVSNEATGGNHVPDTGLQGHCRAVLKVPGDHPPAF